MVNHDSDGACCQVNQDVWKRETMLAITLDKCGLCCWGYYCCLCPCHIAGKTIYGQHQPEMWTPDVGHLVGSDQDKQEVHKCRRKMTTMAKLTRSLQVEPMMRRRMTRFLLLSLDIMCPLQNSYPWLSKIECRSLPQNCIQSDSGSEASERLKDRFPMDPSQHVL